MPHGSAVPVPVPAPLSATVLGARRPWVAQARWTTPLGTVLAACTEAGLGGLWFDGQAHHPGALVAPWAPQHAWLAAARRWLDAYWETGRLHPGMACALDPGGTPFQRAVWQALVAIPDGHRLRYGDIARALDCPTAARAVGAAVGRNPISVLVPCHRVVGSDGRLTGYAGGLERKRHLLDLEARSRNNPQLQGA